jgi:hypothetical protein
LAHVKAGLGVGFTADYVAATEPEVQLLLSNMKLPV